MAQPIPNWQGMGCHASWFGVWRQDLFLDYMKVADSADAGQRQRWAYHCYVNPAQAATQANTEVHQDDDDLQIVPPPALQARRRPPPIIVINEEEDEEEVKVPPNPTEVMQESYQLSVLVLASFIYSPIICSIYVMLSIVPPM
ncbi:hypothetical protein CFC21_035418 [Triticum aestivum]|uniref:Uncharacterized protein n=3 Tax=Triticum TaxID=4564 RepID=A0A9R0VK65_TRITD|nr:hypothetical protein CFC21_035418 [Triticum aestivum]VAH61529.1 unnamed protein product [Triticum turgidum subsp. durum]